MTTLRSSLTFNLALNTLVVVRTQAYNSNGWSELSEPNNSGGRIQTEPIQASAPVKVT